MFFLTRKTPGFVGPEAALAGHDHAMPITEAHVVNGRPLDAPIPEGMAEAMVGMGCFWGVERMFWKLPGVWLTMVGYAGGHTPNPTYREVCSGQTDHNEVVRLIFDPSVIGYDEILRVFWEGHDPTQGMRQGNDVGTQYRSGLYVYSPEQRRMAEVSRDSYAERLAAAGYGPVTTEIRDAPPFYYAEAYHQQYLARNPGGYCGVGGTGVACPVGINQTARG